MKKSVNVYQSKFLKTNSDLFELGCLCVDRITNETEKEWVWLEFKELKDKKYPEQNLVWDSSNYLIDKFYPFLINYLNNKITTEQYVEFSDVLPYLNKEKVEDLIEIFETAKQLNWF